MDLQKINKAHCIGIGGIGVSAIARFFLSMGAEVTGSDMRESKIVDDLRSEGVQISVGHKKENVAPDVQLVVHTEDVNETSPGFVEIQEAQRFGIPTLTYSKALGSFMEGKKGIGVSGTNGKSTTTAMLSLIAEKAGLDPSAVVGSKIPQLPDSRFKGNTRIGKGELFIVEADEYHRHMMDAKPWGIIITNIAADHLDYYQDLNEIKKAFLEYTQALPEDGVLVYNGDDEDSVEVLKDVAVKKLTFGYSENNNLYPLNISAKPGIQTFELVYNKKSLGVYSIKIPGRHNLENAMAATLMALALGIKPEVIRESLAEFPGIWRRFESVGKFEDKLVISDYAHHPDGVLKTLEAARQFFPEAKILTVFQPHQKNRTSRLYNEFLESLKSCDGLILTEIFSVVGREKTNIEISSQSLVNDLSGTVKDVVFAKDLIEAEQLVRQKVADYDLFLFMGAGDIDNLARKLAS